MMPLAQSVLLMGGGACCCCCCCLALFMLLTLAAAEAAAAAHGTTTTTALVCENGESAPVATLIIEPGMDLRRATGALVPGCEHGSCRVFDQLGFEVADAAAVADGQRLFLVPEWRHFIWPAFEVGHKAQWPGEVQVPRLPITLETLSVSPRVFRVTHFFDEFDADFLIENALGITHPQRMLQQSKTGAGNKHVSKIRTSENAFDVNSPVAMKLKRRVFDLLGIRPYNEAWADGLQILRYNSTRKAGYNSHMDAHNPKHVPPGFSEHEFDTTKPWGTNRFATLVLYLNDVERGGQTVFDHGRAVDPELEGPQPLGKADAIARAHRLGLTKGLEPGSWEEELMAKCASRLAVRPRKAEAVLFYSQLPDGRLDDRSVHGGCPVIEGTKWVANLWVWNGDKYVVGAGPQPRHPHFVPPEHRHRPECLLPEFRPPHGEL